MSLEEKLKKLSSKYNTFEEAEFLSTGSVIVDAVIGGGLPKGKFIEIASPSGVGKTTVALHCCKTLAEQGKITAYLDFEHGVNQSQIEGIGLMPHLNKEFLLFQPNTFEDAEDIIDTLKDDIDLFIIDSVTAMLPGSAVDKSIGDLQPGLQARYTSLFLQKYKAILTETASTMLFINQVRTKLNFRGMSSTEAAGGNAQKFYMDVRLQLRKVKKLEKQMDTIEGRTSVEYGADLAIWAIKNRWNPPMIEGVVTVYYGKGVSNLSAYYRWLESKDIIKLGGGGWYTINWQDQEVKKRGIEEVTLWVKENLDTILPYINETGGFILLDN